MLKGQASNSLSRINRGFFVDKHIRLGKNYLAFTSFHWLKDEGEARAAFVNAHIEPTIAYNGRTKGIWIHIRSVNYLIARTVVVRVVVVDDRSRQK